MTKKKKLALLKKGVEVLEPVLKEEGLVPLRGGRGLRRKAAGAVAQALPMKEIKKYGLIAGGVLLGLSAVGNAAHAAGTRMALRAELKRQLKPINEKLDRLEKENAELKARLKEAKK